MSENEKDGASCFLPLWILPLLGGGSGAGTASERKINKLANEGEINELTKTFPITWAGSALIGAIGAIGVVYLLATLKSWRSWGIILLGYLLDVSLTVVLAWSIRESAAANPLGLWPYILSTLATFLAGGAVGFMAPYAPLRHACGIVSVDFLLSGIGGFFFPQAATWKLISRVVAAYCAVACGALIGQYAWVALRKDRTALGRCLGAFVFACITSVVGGVLAERILQYF